MMNEDGMKLPPRNDRRISKSHIKAVDRLYWDPQERAMGVLNIIEAVRQNLEEENEKKNRPKGEDVPTQWDILCFACEHIGQMSITIEDEELEIIARKLISWLYSTHYSYPGTLYGQPDRPKDERKTADDPTWEPEDEPRHGRMDDEQATGDRSESGDSLHSDPGPGTGGEEGSGPS